MPEPTLGQLHVDAALTDFSVAYWNDPSAFAWAQVFPIRTTPKQSDRYHVWTKADLLRSETRKRSKGTESAVRDYSLSNNPYHAERYSIAFDVTEEDLANADPVLNFEDSIMRALVQDLNLGLEIDFASAAFSSNVWGTDSTGADWGNPNSTPIEDIAVGIRTVLQNTGKKPNTLMLGANVWYNALMNHPDIIDRLPDNAPRIATGAFLGNLLGLDRVVVAEAVRNSAQEGATASYGFVQGGHALLAYVDQNPGPNAPTAGVSFVFNGAGGADPSGIRAKRIPIPEKSVVNRLEVDAHVDFVVTGSDLGYMFPNATST